MYDYDCFIKRVIEREFANTFKKDYLEEQQHEHGNHPDFKFQVLVINKETGINEYHALIYTDGYIAVTMYEYCYAVWYINKNELLGGSLWHKNTCKISEDSLFDIKNYIIKHEMLR